MDGITITANKARIGVMTARPEVIEYVARRICRDMGHDPDSPRTLPSGAKIPTWQYYEDEAKGYLAAHAAIEEIRLNGGVT